MNIGERIFFMKLFMKNLCNVNFYFTTLSEKLFTENIWVGLTQQLHTWSLGSKRYGFGICLDQISASFNLPSLDFCFLFFFFLKWRDSNSSYLRGYWDDSGRQTHLKSSHQYPAYSKPLMNLSERIVNYDNEWPEIIGIFCNLVKVYLGQLK